MQKSAKKKAGAKTAGADVQGLRGEIERLNAELEASKRELLEKEKANSSLTEELKALRDENTLGEKEARLERMTAEMERAQEMATMGSWVLEVDTGEVSWTPELHRIFGQDPSSPVPTLEEQETWYTERSWKAMIEAVTRTSEDGSPYNIELEIIRRDGSMGMLRSIGEAERDESGKIVRLRGVAQDISEIKEAEAKLKYALEQERAAKIYKDQFLANMSHEIRTPMNGVVGFASLLRDEELDATTRDEYINTIESCSKQLLNLIDDIIDVAKIEAGEIKIRKKHFNVPELMHEVAATLQTIRQDKKKEHIRLKTHIPEGSRKLQIYSDPLRIQQILTNLLSNALKFSHKGTIDFGFKLEGECVEFFVSDEGIGIAPERRALIFERFEHHEGNTNKYEGTGLGLSISLGLSQLLGGTLSVESELGEGSTFCFKIPLESAESTGSKQAQATSAGDSDEVQAGTVLVVEDEIMNQKFIGRVLKPTPFKVLYVRNGEQAVQSYREHPEIDVVLMDIRVPIMNGDVAAGKILKIDSEAKIIAQTAYAMREERENFLKAGFVDYIAKPYKAGELLDLVKKWI